MANPLVSFGISMLCGYAIEFVQVVMGAANYGSQWNGYGMIDLVNKRAEGTYPTLYRVLVPWLIWLIEKMRPACLRINWYEALKTLLNGMAVWAVWLGWNFETAMVFAVLIMLTIKFDYWDWACEVIGVGFAMTGNIHLAIAGVIIHSLSRETAVLGGVLYWMVTGDILGGIGLVGLAGCILLSVHLWKDGGKLKKVETVGRLYFIKLTWEKLKKAREYYPKMFVDIIISVFLSVIILIAIVQFPVGWLIPLILLAAGWTLAQPEETRVFSACLPWAAAMIVGWVR